MGSQPRASDQGDVYYVKGDRNLSVSIVLPDKRRYEFDSVADAYVTRRGDKVRTIDIASFGYSAETAIQQLGEMHKKWNGRGLDDLYKWRTDITEQRDLSGHSTLIHDASRPDDPSIAAAIHYNFGQANNEWYIMVTFFWKAP